MNEQRVYSRNATFQMFEVLKTNRNKRYRYGRFFVEGVRNLNEAVARGWSIVSFLYAGDMELSGWARDMLRTVQTEVNYRLSPDLMAALSGKQDASELLAIAAMRDDDVTRLQWPESPRFVLFDRPSNRGNLGTLIRSCDALGADGLILTGHGVDPYDADVITSSMGSFFRVPVVRLADNASVLTFIEACRTRYPGFAVVGTTAHRESPAFSADLSGPLLLMIGNETEGLNRQFKALCDQMITIPMAEDCAASSLNVGCAASILLYEAARQRAAR